MVVMVQLDFPVAWTLYGLVTSQFGDLKTNLDTGVAVEQYLDDYFGLKYDFLGVVAAVVIYFLICLCLCHQGLLTS